MKEHLWEIEPELYRLVYALVLSLRPKGVVETGTFTGKATLSIAKALKENKDGHLWSIDHKDYGAKKILGEVADFVDLIVEKSPSALEKVMSGNEIDFVFLDNGHLYPTVSAELVVAHKYLLQGGYIAGHDYRPEHTGVFPAVNDFFESHKDEYEKITITSENGFFLMRKI